MSGEWITGRITTTAGDIPQVATKRSFTDTIGSWKCRWSIGRMDYRVIPGLYAIGTPDETAPVLVTANYKMTFDRLREQLGGLNLWIVVLDTDGVNVWCAAGKGTFGTEEIIRRIFAVQLVRVVTHRTIILPQLGAVGIAAHEVKKQTGFHVVYGPVRAEDRVFRRSGNRIIIGDRDSCMECGACAKNCPFNAIEVDEGVGCAAAIIRGFFTGEIPTCG